MREFHFYAVQLPFNLIDDEAAREAIPLAADLDMGFIAMKPIGGGLLTDASLAIRFLTQFPGIIPDPGIEHIHEMAEIIQAAENTAPLSDREMLMIAETRADLGSRWCHRCDYCQPCPNGIPISLVLSVESVIKRMPRDRAVAISDTAVQLAETCTACGSCVKKCPYNLCIPDLIKEKCALWKCYMADNA